MIGRPEPNSDRSFNAFAHASLLASIKERTTSSAEASWCWAPSSDNVEYVATVNRQRRLHAAANAFP